MSNFDINKFINSVIDSQQSLLISMKNQYKINLDETEFISNFSLDKNKLMELVFENMELKIAFNSSKENNLQENAFNSPNKEDIKDIPKMFIKKKKNNKQNKSIESYLENTNKMIIKKKRISPKQFDNEYAYFVYMCQSLSLEYYKYKLSNLWDSPAIIIKQTKNNLCNIRQKFDIELIIDILEDQQIAIYPKKINNSSSIKYTKQYEFNNYTRKQTYNDNVNNVEVLDWTFNDVEYLLDTHTNNVYDIDSQIIIGKREYDNSKNSWYIRSNY